MEQAWSRAKGAFAALIGPPSLYLTVFFLLPLAIVWLYSFGETRDLTSVAVTGTIANYAQAISPLYAGVLLKSLLIAAAVTAVCLVAGFPVALAIAFAPPRLKAWLLVLVMLPFWTNLLIRTYALMAILRPLQLLHTDAAVIVGQVYVELPFMILPLYAALERMDRSLLEASLDLGAGHLATLKNIALPLAAPGIASGVVLTFIPSVGAFLTPDLLGGPGSQMISNVIERQFKRANDWPFGAALSFVLMYLTFLAIAGQALLARRHKQAAS
jgi:spermidine/putrescine transport system permease protein